MPTSKSKQKPKVALKKDRCCCGATKTIPCICMVYGLKCSNVRPKCLCFKLLHKQTRK